MEVIIGECIGRGAAAASVVAVSIAVTVAAVVIMGSASCHLLAFRGGEGFQHNTQHTTHNTQASAQRKPMTDWLTPQFHSLSDCETSEWIEGNEMNLWFVDSASVCMSLNHQPSLQREKKHKASIPASSLQSHNSSLLWRFLHQPSRYSFTNSQKWSFYGPFKKATVGDCT